MSSQALSRNNHPSSNAQHRLFVGVRKSDLNLPQVSRAAVHLSAAVVYDHGIVYGVAVDPGAHPGDLMRLALDVQQIVVTDAKARVYSVPEAS